MHSVRLRGRRQAFLLAAIFLLGLWPAAAPAIDLFARHRVSVQFATADGKPLADAEVQVFAPGQPNRPVQTGRTDSAGKFEFTADEEGFWTAEARAGDQIARAAVRVGGAGQKSEPLSPLWLIGGLLLLLVAAFAVRLARARRQR